MSLLQSSDNVNHTVTGVAMAGCNTPAQAVWLRTEAGWAAHELITLYRREFGGDWKQYYEATVRIEVQLG